MSAINVCYWEVFPWGVYSSSFRSSTFCPLFGDVHYFGCPLIGGFTVVSVVVKGGLSNKTVNYDTKTKAYVPIWAESVSD